MHQDKFIHENVTAPFY